MLFVPMSARRLTTSLAVAAFGVLVSCGGGNTGGGGGGGGSAPAYMDPIEGPAVVGGVLSAQMTVVPAMLDVAGEKDVVFFSLYNGDYMPQTLRADPGDRVDILLQNYAVDPTNLHYHGMIITPTSESAPALGGIPPVNGDNIFLSVTPGTEFLYSFPIPATHPQGMFWYHPHRDPLLNTQISGGMSGAIIIGDILEPFPELADVPERVMVLKDLKLMDKMPVEDPDPAGPTKRTINGLWKPQIEMVPGQMEFWRIGNQSSNIFYQLTFGGQPFHIIGVDGSLENQVITETTMVLPPGSRREVLVYGPPKGSYQLKTEAFNTGPDGDAYPGQVLATIKSSGTPVEEIALPADFPVIPDMTSLVTKTKTVVFSDTANPNQFFIDGKPFTPDCIDYFVDRTDDAVEEWTIQNTAGEAHVFHIHQLDFQVTEVNGVPTPFTGYQDVVTLPAAIDDDTPSEVKVIIPFSDPIIAGKFVYHCHIIQHEDQGMMATIFVQDAGGPTPVKPPCHPDE